MMETIRRLPTLDEFMTREGRWQTNGDVYVPGFKRLYVRRTQRYMDGEVVKTIDIGVIEAEWPGEGAFTRLVEMMRERWPECRIYVENVTAKRWARRLLRDGWVRVDGDEMVASYASPGR